MFFNHIFDFIARYLLTQLLHCKVDVFFGDLTRVVCVKLLEDGLHFLFRHESTYIYGCGQELTVIDLAVAMVVNLLNHLLDFFC